MKIKKLELIGFKSFVDRTVLHFDHDVLAIVGPNGCGKSNIVDAIRWCMGEQSARHLRGRSMDDVLFSGSESRAPQDFAEVTLTFDNDEPRELPLEFKHYAEIAVTRRLHRSGESEYLINKVGVRQRDVTDLFLGTGAGTKAYSIVEQGKVGLIVSAKPEDRRLLIEEAAGITKFKSRKKHAEKKMDLTQQNLLRVADLVSEIERSLVSLKRQAAKAERYVSYRNELEDLQLHEAAHRYLELFGWIKLETGEVSEAADAHERVCCELSTRETELEVMRLDVHACDERLGEATNASFAAGNGVRAEEAAILRAKDRLAALVERQKQAEAEGREIGEHCTRLASEQRLAEREVEGLCEAEAVAASDVARQEQALADYAAAHAIADGRAAERRHAIANARAEIARAEGKLAGLERRGTEMTARRERVDSEARSLQQARADLDVRVQDMTRSIDDLRAAHATTVLEKSTLDARLAESKQLIVELERSLEESRAELSRKRSRYGALEEMHARLEGVGAGAKTLVGTGDPCVAGLVADRIEAPEHLTQALAGLLGAKLQHVVVRNVRPAVSLLEGLARQRTGRATIVPLRSSFVAGAGAGPLPTDDGALGRLVDALRYEPEDESLVHTLVGDCLVVRDLESALRLRTAGVGCVMAALDGSVLHPDGRIDGGQEDELAAGMLESKREARELAHEIERLDTIVSRKIEAHQSARQEIARTGVALDRVRSETHARELALVTAEKDLQKTQAQGETVARRLESLEIENTELTRAFDEALRERDGAVHALSQSRALVETAQEELLQVETALEEARQRLEAHRQAVTSSKIAVAGVRERLAAARGAESRLRRSAAELEERTARIDAELTANARSFDETTADLKAHEQGLQSALDRARAANTELEGVRAVAEELRGVLIDREGTIKDLRVRAAAVRERLQAHEMALRERQIAMDHLVAGVADKFRGMHLPHVVGDHHMRAPPDGVSRARIEELVRLIERMGGVNLDAMREHAEAESRFTFYTTQKADLERALLDLQRAIAQMNRESRRLFEETFAAVNERFREIFPRMFRGGCAELRMTDPDDLLETGIDIVAQPPGKKLSSIELMSGGEKALTAVSLIFAIFQIKPSPFCILDEVDAPLDEANVARYNELIRSMTDQSQFILITHVKRTMQMVDVLYGVTMPEAGISKIVSVKINDSVQHRASTARGDLREAVA